MGSVFPHMETQGLWLYSPALPYMRQCGEIDHKSCIAACMAMRQDGLLFPHCRTYGNAGFMTLLIYIHQLIYISRLQISTWFNGVAYYFQSVQVNKTCDMSQVMLMAILRDPALSDNVGAMNAICDYLI